MREHRRAGGHVGTKDGASTTERCGSLDPVPAGSLSLQGWSLKGLANQKRLSSLTPRQL